MSCVRLLLASAATVALGLPLGAQATRPPQRCEGADAPLSVRVDSAKREVVILVGPCIVHPMDMSGMEGMAGMAGMDMSKMSEMGEYSGKVDVRTGFVWPASMYMRGWDLTVLDSLGRRLPQNTMHHMELVNFDRRQLVYPMAERVLGIGEETGPALIPKSVGMPLTKGTHMGLYVMWNNTTDTDMRGIYMQVRMKYSPMNMTPKPVVVLPFKVDVNLHPGMGDAFDVKDGHGSRAATFTVPIAGRLIAIGGHLHDYGKELRLEDVATGKVIARVRAKRRPDGTVTDVEHKLFGIWARGPHLVPGRTYRIVAVYDNPKGEAVMGAMGLFGGIFAPDNLADWPPVDPNDPQYKVDVADNPAYPGTKH